MRKELSSSAAPCSGRADTTIPLSELSLALRQATGRDAPGVRKLHQLLIDGRLGATGEKMSGRWHVQRRDLPAIERQMVTLGLMRPGQPEAAPRNKRTSSEQNQAAA